MIVKISNPGDIALWVPRDFLMAGKWGQGKLKRYENLEVFLASTPHVPWDRTVLGLTDDGMEK